MCIVGLKTWLNTYPPPPLPAVSAIFTDPALVMQRCCSLSDFAIVAALHVGAGNACVISDDRTRVNCTGTLPDNVISVETTSFVLTGSQLTSVPSAQLAVAANLRYLELSFNFKLSTLTNDSFSTTPNLEILILMNNGGLEEIHIGAFKHLGRLIELFIRGTTVTTLHRSHFTPLTSLKTLLFAFSPVSKTTPDLFTDLVSLVDFELSACGVISTALTTQSLGLATLPHLDKMFVSLRPRSIYTVGYDHCYSTDLFHTCYLLS